MSANLCVCCGAIIPEGRQVCPACERTETIEPFKTKNKTEKEPNKMKDYYETKRRRYQEILAAYDRKVGTEITIEASKAESIDELIEFLLDIKGTRELITSEIDYLNERLAKLEAEAKAEETTEKEEE